MRKYKKHNMLACIMSVIVLAGCYCHRDGVIAVRCDAIDVGSIIVSDSTSATFRFKNKTYVDQVVTFHSESEGTTLSVENIKIGAHRVGRLEVKVVVDSPGEFAKFVHVEAANGDVSYDITVKGCGR